MAELVLSGIATVILKSIASEIAKPGSAYASQMIQLLCCAEGELHSLKDTVKAIQAGLLDAEKRQWQEDGVKSWLKELKDVLYDIQDLLDDISTEDLRRQAMAGNEMMKEVHLFFSESNQLVHRFNVAIKIRQLRKKLEKIEKDGEFKFEPSEEIKAIGKKPESLSPDAEIIGRQKDKEKIKQLLFDSSSSDTVSVVFIAGKGGLGKTALARLVYDDGEVKGHFGVKMWVCVSDVFDVNLVIKAILKSAKADCRGHDDEMKNLLQDLEDKPMDQLQSLLHKTLGRKKYLLVLDDMWNENRLKWLELGDWLKSGMQGSKILVTTRSHTVAKVIDEKAIVYDLEGLPRDESWNLFRKVAFGDGQDSIDQRLEEMGRDIVRKCAGVPLAIRTIASLLYGKKEDEWHRFKLHELPELPEIDMVDNGIMQVLKFSYDHLHSCLKHCFAYCSLFPKDYVYDKEMMIRLWVAQGFIESLNGEDNLEKTASKYFLDLQYRSFLDAADVDDDGEVLTFTMHDLMHDLAQNVAIGECKVFNFNEEGIDGGIRHVSFISEIFFEEKMVSLLKTSKLRTFLCLEDEGLEQDSSVLDKVFSELRHCRVLGLGRNSIPLPPSSLGKMKHLRFLDVSENQSIQSLPDSITNLVNLQTLNLSGCKNLATLPKDLRKLINLRHLIIEECCSLSHMPCGLNHLSSLQTLSIFIVQKMDHKVPSGVGSLDELAGLNKLAGSITLENLGFLQPAHNKGYLREKQHLRCLVLSWQMRKQDDESENDESILWENLRPHPNLACLAISSGIGRSPPSWLSSIKKLVQLNLGSCKVWTYLPSLSELPFLRILNIVYLDALEFIQEISGPEQSNTTRPFFPSLEEILLNCKNLKGWWGRKELVGANQDHWRYDSHSSFPKLSAMQIIDCVHLNSLPLFPWINDLYFSKGSAKLLDYQAMAIPNYPSEVALSTSIPLSKLEHLVVELNEDLEHSTLETLLPFLKNLKKMRLNRCYKIRSLSRGMQYLSSLLCLHISACEELDLWSHDDEHGTQWRSLVNLRDLTIGGLPKLVALPEGIQHVTTLKSLEVLTCENLKSLPEWIGNFSSLEQLDISECSGLTCLPDGLRHLTSLKRLIIYGCPVLEERCQRESGVDWEKIAHLPCSQEKDLGFFLNKEDLDIV